MSANEVTIAGETRLEKGRLVLDVTDEAKRQMARSIQQWGKPRQVTIRVREGREPKSAAQLRYLHGKVFRDIAEETGNRPELVKDELKKKFLSRREEFTDMETGEMSSRVYVPSLSELDVEDMNRFIDECVLFAAEFLGMTIEPPDPAWKSKREAAA
jgi:hypothetical protein